MTNALSIAMAACLLAAGSFFSISAIGAGTPTTKPAATQTATPACCGDACKKMAGCCKVDDKGAAACSMGGSCCVKPDATKPAALGTGGMNMGAMCMGNMDMSTMEMSK